MKNDERDEIWGKITKRIDDEIKLCEDVIPNLDTADRKYWVGKIAGLHDMRKEILLILVEME